MERLTKYFVGIFIFFLISIFPSFSQTTIDFNSYSAGGLSNPHIEGELEFEVIINTSNCTTCIGIEVDGGKDGTPGLEDLNLQINGITGWKISKADNSSFQFISIWLQERGLSGISTSGTIKAFKSGSQVGSTVNIDFNSASTGLKIFSSNPDFYDVDEVRIEADDIFMILDEITYDDPLTVGDTDPAKVTGINLVGSPLSTASSVTYKVDFSKIALNVSSDDFELTTTGTASGSIGTVSGSGSSYTVPVTGLSGEGTIRLDLKAGTDIENENNISGTAAYTSGQIHNVSPCLVEDFEDETDGSSSFSYGGFTFSIIGNMEVHTETPPIGINGSSKVLINTGSGTYTISSGVEFNFKKFAVYLSSDANGNTPTDDGSITVVGKNGGAQVYSVTKASGFPTDFSANSGYYIFDLKTEGGTDNSLKSVDEIEISIGGSFQYINIDNFEFCADDIAPSGYTVSIDQDPITTDNDDAVSFTFSGAEVGTTYEYSFTSSGGGTVVTGSGTILTSTDQITGIDLSGLGIGTITLTVNLTDASNNEGAPAQDNVEKKVNNAPVASAPTISGVQEDVVYDIPDEIQVADVDGDELTLTFTITGGTVTLGTSGITFGGSGNGSASFTAEGTLADLNTALDAATFVSDLNLNGAGAGTIAFVANDGSVDSNTASVTFDIEAINDDPFATGFPSSISATEDVRTTSINLSSVTLSDVDAGNSNVTLIISADNGTLTIAAFPGIVQYQGNFQSTIRLTGPLSVLNDYIDLITNLTYQGNQDISGNNADVLTVMLNDNGNTGVGGGADVLLGTVNVNISPVNDDPTFTGLPTDITVQDGVASNIDLSSATFGDVDSGSGNVRLSFLVSGGTLSATSTADVTVSSLVPGTMDLVGTAAALETFLNTPSSIQYTNSPGSIGDNAATLSVSANDNGNTGTGGGLSVNFGTINIDVETFKTFTINDVSVAEGDAGSTNLQFTVSLDAPAPAGGATVDYATSNGTAIAGSDYTAANGTLSFAEGESSKTIDISVSGDENVELDETLTLTLSNPTGTGIVIGDDTGTGTITNDDQVTVTIADVAVNENSGTATITLMLDNAVDGGFDVDVSTADGTATTADNDYTSVTNQTITFAGTAGETETFNIALGGDTKVEADETVSISMSGLNANTVAGGDIDITDGATFTILNDDQAFVTIADVSGNEDDGPITITVTLENAVEGGFDVDVSTADGTATVADSDYSAIVNQTLTFAGTVGETETFTVTPIADSDVESNETVLILMSNLVPTTVAGGDIDISDGATLIIQNDDINAPSTPDLVPSSDSGISDSDDITNDRTPTLQGTADPNTTIEIFSSVDGSLGETTSNNVGVWEFTPASELNPTPGATAVSHDFTARSKDVFGNFSDSGPLTVVIDTKAPAPVIFAGLTLQLDNNGITPSIFPSDLLAVPISDDYSAPGAIQLTLNVNSFDCADIGPNIVRLTATDEAGNSDYAETTVFVQDIISPTIVAKASITLNVDAFGSVTLTPNMVDEGSFDNCGIQSQVFSQSTFDRTDEGVKNITYTVTDVNGNPSQVNIAVTIVVVPKVLNITVDAGQSKVYGDADPEFSFVADGFEAGDDETILTGALARAAGEDVGTYAINLGTLDAGPNYAINFIPADFAITPATLDIMVDAGQIKVYGDADPAFTYQYTGLKNGDTNAVITGALARAAGEDVGMYPINVGTLDAGPNYSINYTGADFEITQATLDITADAGQSKVYGEADPVFTYQASGFKLTDTEAVISGSLIRVAGEDVGTYAIQPGTIAAGPNYAINFTSADFAITPATLDITADAGQSKVYGNADPVFTYQVTGYQNGDNASILTGSLARAAGEDVGTYAINLGTLSAGANYTINYTGADFTITPRTLDITANPNQVKVYGSSDPVFAYTASNFGNGDNTSILTGALSRVAGEDVGMYAITIGTLDAGSNYVINFTSADFEIAEKVLDVTADAGQSKVFGIADPTLTYQVTGFENGDDETVLTGALARAAGENVGSYAINLGSLNAGSNYAINYTGASFMITKAMITGITFADGSFVFDGTEKSLSITGTLPAGTSVAYTNNGRTDVGSQEVTATITGPNYTTLVLTADLTIIPAEIGAILFADASFEYDGTEKSLAISGTLPAGTSLAYSNNGRTDVGTQEVTATITGPNYTTLELKADLTITAKDITVTADTGQSKIAGEADPILTYTATGLAEGEGMEVFAGSLSRAAGEDPGMYAITRGTLSAGNNYTITFIGADFEIIDGDTDGDGVPDQQEEEDGTDPTDPTDFKDTDGDGVPDYVEEEQGTDPADSEDYKDQDGDQVPDYVEVQQGTDPNNPEDAQDTDGDGIPDYVQERSITELVAQSIQVAWNTPEVSLNLPSEAMAITGLGEMVNVPVTWDLTGYDPLMSGTTSYEGMITTIPGIFNTYGLTAELSIEVLAKPAPTDVTLSEDQFIGIPDQYFQEIGFFTVIDATDDQHSLSLPEGMGDNELFEVIDGILFWSSQDQRAGETQFEVVLEVEDRAGNVIQKTFLITRLRTPLSDLDVVNTFTPNADGVNDTWGVPALRYYRGSRIQVFDRGGKRLFYTEDPDVQWDGTFEGEELPVGAYYWVIEVEETGEVRRGVLNLLRQ